jgi:hypothetical protein
MSTFETRGSRRAPSLDLRGSTREELRTGVQLILGGRAVGTRWVVEAGWIHLREEWRGCPTPEGNGADSDVAWGWLEALRSETGAGGGHVILAGDAMGQRWGPNSGGILMIGLGGWDVLV